MLHEDRFVLRLFLLLVVLSMVAELGGIITLNVLGQVDRSEQLIFFVADRGLYFMQ